MSNTNELMFEVEMLRIALTDLLVNINEDVPADTMSKHFLTAIVNAEDILADLGDIDHKEEV
jgi:hypothetical protein